MKASRHLVPCIIGALALACVRCTEDNERAEKVASMLGPEGGSSAVGDDTLGAQPLSPAAGMMPASSCGPLLGASTCDPVTAWPCNEEAGETCDYSNSLGAFKCYLLPTAVPFCGFCDRDIEYCGRGTSCGASRCEKFCCADSDCLYGACRRAFDDRGLELAGYCQQDAIETCGPDPALESEDEEVDGIDDAGAVESTVPEASDAASDG